MRHALTSMRLHVPDLGASIDHLVGLLGMHEVHRDHTLAALALPGQPPSVELATGAAAIESMTLATTPANQTEIADRAHAHGVAVVVGGDAELELTAPNGVVVRVVVGQAPVRNTAVRNDGPVIGSLDHLSFTARDIGAAVRFFCDVLGFRVSDRVGESRYWLRCNDNHHTVALFAGADGLQHYAFETRDAVELARLGDALAGRGQNFLWGLGRHGLGENVFSYHLDPAGAILEVCSDMVQIPDGTRWETGVWAEDSTASAIRWGQLPPPEFRQTMIPSAARLARA